MASRCPEDERRAPPRPSGSTGAGPAARSTAAHAAGELALAVLAPAGPPQLTILGHLHQEDKMRLGSTCSSLRQASLTWFSEVFVHMFVIIDVASLAAWLERHPAWLHVRDLVNASDDAVEHKASEVEWNDTLTALPPAQVTSLAVRLQPELPTSVSTLTALTRLEFTANNGEDEELRGNLDTHLLRPLTRLRHLRLENCDLGVTAEELLSLPALAGLQVLQLPFCDLEQVPSALSALTHLTSLVLYNPIIMSAAPLATLWRLESLELDSCRFEAVPHQLSMLTALTRLNLHDNPRLVGGWQHLLPMRQLRELDLSWCYLTAIPQELSALTALTSLDLGFNRHMSDGWRHLSDGWQHLLPLRQLQDLSLHGCGLTAVPDQVSALTALTSLALSHNKLESGWQHLLPLRQLQGLNLSECGLTAVPQELSALTALNSMDLGGNKHLTSGWQHLLPLMRLRNLNFRFWGFTSVPEQVSALTALTRLNLSGNRLESGWQYLLPLLQLQDLNLSECRLTSVPEQVSAMTALACLNLTGNTLLVDGWQHLLPLRQLLDLSLRGCGVSAVPEQVSSLTALTCLNLSWNDHLCVGWQHLLPLKRLCKLNLMQVPFKRVPHALAARLHLLSSA
ncbi:hypothetical protein D9Q98_005730 [Chlorella vulgaris]|uniref:Uncharacterized protein n=1 Tax=Chlorella vulgaris TaxID=3077 RepID=A0A9D4TMM5_CHLVU|nr:hypothetical protein D9Q98_005730 [Chlorella vulgaris]